MKRNFDKILLGILWVVTVVLATTFWMNMRYGFNIFSSIHWKYLSELQATRTNIKPEFYISLVVAIVLALAGLYLIVRPRFRKIHFPTQPKIVIQPEPQQPIIPQQPSQQPTVLQPNTPNVYNGPSALARPLSPIFMQTTQRQKQFVPPTQRLSTNPPTFAKNAQPAPIQPNNIENPFSQEMSRIFESVGYIMKPCNHIEKLKNPIVALGYNQTLWIGASDAAVSDVIDAIQTIVALFEETLGDSANDINIRACVIAPTDATKNVLVSTFGDIRQFETFMTENPNTQPKDFDKELFDAISTYISTVTNYIGKN